MADSQSRFVADCIRALNFPALAIGPDQSVIAANGGACALLGDHVTGRHYITALRQPLLLDKIEAVLKNRNSEAGAYLGRDASRDTNFAVHISAAGEFTILTFEDRTAAEDIGQFRRDFVANVSHELRTPLTALLGFIETLRGAAKDDPVARERFLSIMEREAGRMTRLVDDLLSLSRLEANERIRPSSQVVLSDIVSGTLTELDPLLEANGNTVVLNDQSGDATIAADPGELRQVIGNLIENAVKYGMSGTPVEIEITAPQRQSVLRAEGVCLSVTDHGQGIAAHHIPRLTERFYRVDDHRSREVGGTGLGLAIVKHIISRHRGRILIESDVGVGTTITVVLPTGHQQKRELTHPTG